MTPEFIEAAMKFKEDQSWDGVGLLSDLWYQLTEDEQQELNERELGIEDVLIEAYDPLLAKKFVPMEKN